MSDRPFSVVVPILNMKAFVRPLTASFLIPPFGDLVHELIFVCDKSTDGTEEEILQRASEQKPGEPKIRLIQPVEKRGHFGARYLGALHAERDTVFFVDARVQIPKASAEALKGLIKEYPALVANIDIDVNKNLFCLYWQRSHETIFRKTFEANRQVNVITSENYAEMRIGTTCFYCSRQHFLKACEPFLFQYVFSDDTMVQRELVKFQPLALHPKFRVLWEPRNRWWPFLKHLFIRGPGFADYHLFKHRGWLFYAVLFGTLFAMGSIVMLFIDPLPVLFAGVLVLLAMAMTTLTMAKSFTEFLIMAPLHTLSMIFYGIGGLHGIRVVLRRRREEALHPITTPPTARPEQRRS